MDKRAKIREILLENDKTIGWLKNKIKIAYPDVDLYYQLSDKSVVFDTDLYDYIIDTLRKSGFIASEDERAVKFADQLIHLNGIINHSVSLLNFTSAEFLKDNKLTFDERAKLVKIIEKAQSDNNDEYERVKKIIKGNE